MNRKSLDPRDRLFFVALVVQLTVSAVLGVAIVRAIDRAGRVQVIGGALPSARPEGSAAPTTGTGPTTRTHTTVIGGRAGSRTGGGSTGVSAGEIRIGGVFTLSGPADATPAVHAVQAYFNTVNEAGGVFGRRLTYVVRDDKFDPAIGYQSTKDFIEN
ncbi:MAG: ABC transporter substrate-binding protein [Acidobacteria bacterium]|nr:ABC transporter substrate-binding protein [Acidobacteriota bacterium]